MLTDSGRCRRWFRRYCDGTCPLNPGQYSYHNKEVLAEDTATIINPNDRGISCEQLNNADSRWPTQCDCGFVFPENTIKQTFYVAIYLTPDNKEVTIHESKLPGIEKAPAGALWYADWYSWRGPDGRSLAAMTPGGIWLIDGPSSSGSFPWKRTGIPPNITVSPSINITGRYHGFLTNGEFTDDLEKREG